MSEPLPNLRHLDVFLELARQRSISAAARAVHLSQPAVSQILAGSKPRSGRGCWIARAAGSRRPRPASTSRARAARAWEQIRDGLAEAGYARPGDRHLPVPPTP
jgi:DNA-binding transcriptional LysR family regulator